MKKSVPAKRERTFCCFGVAEGLDYTVIPTDEERGTSERGVERIPCGVAPYGKFPNKCVA